MLLHSTASSSTFKAHPHHTQPLLHFNLMNSLPQWMVGHPKPDGQHASTALSALSMHKILCPFSYSVSL